MECDTFLPRHQDHSERYLTAQPRVYPEHSWLLVWQAGPSVVVVGLLILWVWLLLSWVRSLRSWEKPLLGWMGSMHRASGICLETVSS